MSKVLAVASQKGGVGKTTTAVNLSAIWAMEGDKVLLIDIDPQGNATEGLGIKTAEIENTTAEVLMNEANIKDAILSTKVENLYILPADAGLSRVEAENISINSLKQNINEIKDDYDYIVIDCPPSLSRLTINAMIAADRVLIPVKPGKFSIIGLRQIFDLVESLRLRKANTNLRILGIFYNEAQTNTNLFKAVNQSISKHYSNFILNTIVPSNVKLGEAQIIGEPINIFDKSSKGYESFSTLAQEVKMKWPEVQRVR